MMAPVSVQVFSLYSRHMLEIPLRKCIQLKTVQSMLAVHSSAHS
jgi:hypothetical protein